MNLRLLIIDDDELDRLSIVRALRNSHITFDIFQSATAANALELASKQHFDAILLDYNLPGQSGLDVLKRLRDGRFEAVAVIMLSHQEDDTLIEQCLDAGAQDFLLKSDVTGRRLARSIKQAKQRHEIENALKASREQLRKLSETFINHAPISIAMFDRNMNYLAASGRWLEEYGQGYNNLTGCNHYQIHPDLPQEWKSIHQQGMGGVTLKNNEDLWTKADGSKHWLRWAVAPWIDENAEIGGIIISTENITSRKLNEEKLAEQTQKLYESDQRKDQFLAMLAHELRNPLAPICNAAQILKRTDLEPDRIAWCSQIIERQTEHMVGIVNDLLDVSRINRGLIELNKESLEIRDVILPAIECCRPLIDAKRHEFCLELPPEPLWVEGDRIRLTQVVVNLLNNAAKYTEDGGLINLSVELCGDTVCIRVNDNGCGIDAADLPNLFDLFYQTDRNLDRSQGGLGIGLSLVRNLVAKHGGNVQASSAGHGKGSEFVVRLQRHVLPKPEVTCSAALAAPPQKKRRIMLVDDNRDAAESLAILLEIDGHQVQTAYDGPAALKIAQVERHDVILLDIGLPGMNGYSVAQELRKFCEPE